MQLSAPTRFLQITFSGNPILPRQQILAAPVALRAQISDTVTNGAIGTAQIADGSITAAKISGGTGSWVGSGQDIYHLNGNVGIGTTGPSSKLVVQADAPASSQQLVLQGNANPNKQFLLSYNTANNYGSIQPIEQGVAVRDMVLMPIGTMSASATAHRHKSWM